MGLNWNVKGTRTVADVLAALRGEAPKAGGVPPPPPVRLPPPPPVNAPLAVSKAPAADTGALFAELNVGEDITKSMGSLWQNFFRIEEGR